MFIPEERENPASQPKQQMLETPEFKNHSLATGADTAKAMMTLGHVGQMYIFEKASAEAHAADNEVNLAMQETLLEYGQTNQKEAVEGAPEVKDKIRKIAEQTGERFKGDPLTADMYNSRVNFRLQNIDLAVDKHAFAQAAVWHEKELTANRELEAKSLVEKIVTGDEKSIYEASLMLKSATNEWLINKGIAPGSAQGKLESDKVNAWVTGRAVEVLSQSDDIAEIKRAQELVKDGIKAKIFTPDERVRLEKVLETSGDHIIAETKAKEIFAEGKYSVNSPPNVSGMYKKLENSGMTHSQVDKAKISINALAQEYNQQTAVQVEYATNLAHKMARQNVPVDQITKTINNMAAQGRIPEQHAAGINAAMGSGVTEEQKAQYQINFLELSDQVQNGSLVLTLDQAKKYSSQVGSLFPQFLKVVAAANGLGPDGPVTVKEAKRALDVMRANKLTSFRYPAKGSQAESLFLTAVQEQKKLGARSTEQAVQWALQEIPAGDTNWRGVPEVVYAGDYLRHRQTIDLTTKEAIDADINYVNLVYEHRFNRKPTAQETSILVEKFRKGDK